MAIKGIHKLKIAHMRMTTVLNELEILEYDEDMEYEEMEYAKLVKQYIGIVNKLENRRTILQKKGRYL